MEQVISQPPPEPGQSYSQAGGRADVCEVHTVRKRKWVQHCYTCFKKLSGTIASFRKFSYLTQMTTQFKSSHSGMWNINVNTWEACEIIILQCICSLLNILNKINLHLYKENASISFLIRMLIKCRKMSLLNHFLLFWFIHVCILYKPKVLCKRYIYLLFKFLQV